VTVAFAVDLGSGLDYGTPTNGYQRKDGHAVLDLFLDRIYNVFP
jgi:hypothetical protein